MWPSSFSDNLTAAAHRLFPIRSADVIFVLQSGRVAEQGTHRELMRAGGLYARMVTQQAGDTLLV